MNSKQYKSIDQYIRAFPKNIQTVLKKIRKVIKNNAPQAQEAIKYQIPTFILNGNLVHFAAWEKHIGFYPTPSITRKFKNELAKYEFAKGSIKFPLSKPMPFGLIKKIVQFRVKENLAKQGNANKGKRKDQK